MINFWLLLSFLLLVAMTILLFAILWKSYSDHEDVMKVLCTIANNTTSHCENEKQASEENEA